MDNIQNISECYCCQELEGCVESMSSELVLQDLAADEQKLLECITAHPGFNAVCLKKRSLRLAADKYRTKGIQKYRQTGSAVFPLRASLGYDCASFALLSERF